MAQTAIGIRAARELDQLYRAHAAEVYRYVYAVLGNGADAEDVTQTTFMNALRALERGERPRKPTNWLITIAHNVIRQRFRQQQARPREVELDRDVATFEADDNGPSIDDLVRALQRIPPAQREALVLREMEGRSYKEIAPILGVSITALETLIFRARRSLADELENLVTCDRAELALSKRADGRLGRTERKRLVAHLEVCASCARVAAVSLKHRRAFKGLAVLPLPWSLTFFNGAPSASAAVGLPTIGGAAAAGVGAGGLTAKLAVGLAAVAVASGAGYETVQAVRDPTPVRPAKPTPEAIVPAAQLPAVARAERPTIAKPKLAKTKLAKKVTPAAKKPDRVKPAQAKSPGRGRSAVAIVKGRSAVAPGQLKAKPTPKPKATTTPKATTKPKTTPTPTPKTTPTPKLKLKLVPKVPGELRPVIPPLRGKSADPPGRVPPVEPKPKQPSPEELLLPR